MLTTVIVPCYNEANRLDLTSIESFLGTAEAVRLLFVDDGSKDETGVLLERISERFPGKASLLRLPKNRGKAEAVRAGFVHALSEWEQESVGFWDADLATPLGVIPVFVRLLQSNPIDIVFGSRVKLCGRHIDRRATRHYLGRIFATVVSTMLGLAIYDTQCGAKLFRVDERLKHVFSTPFESKWVFDVEVLARFLQSESVENLERRLYEYPLETWRDVAGSKVRPTDFLKAIGEVAKIWSRYMRGGRKE